MHILRDSDRRWRPSVKRVVRLPRMMLWALVMEGVDTKDMVFTFVRQGAHKLLQSDARRQPSPEELARAKAQLRNLPRFLPFIIIVVVPAPGVTEGYALLAITLEKWLGNRIRLLPARFRRVFERSEK